MLVDQSLTHRICRQPGQFFLIFEDHENDVLKRPADLFRVLLETAASDRFAVSQQAQACAAVCALIKSGLAQKKGPLWTIVSPAVTLRPLLNICLGQSYRLKTKDTRQIFVAIHSLLTESVKQNCCLKDEVRTVLITSITSNNIHNVVKAALQILQYLVKRGIFEPQELAEALSVVEKKSSSGNNGKEASLHRFLDALLHWVPFPNLAPASGALMEVFCDSWNRAFENASYITSVELEALWITPLQAAVKESRDSLEAFKNHVFPGLFKLCRRHTESYLLQVGLREFLAGSTMDISAFELFCAALEVSKESGLVEEVDFDGDNRVADHQPSRIFDSGKAHIPSTAISIFVSHKSSQIRISALSLLITSTSTTQPFSGVVLRTMASNFTHFINEPDAKMRQDILGQMLRVLKRVRGACLFLRNKQKRLNDRAQKDDIGTIQHEVLQMIIDRHKAFLTKVLCKAIDGMNPSANYPSLSFSLGFFEMLMQSGIDPSIYQNRKVKEDAKQWGWPFHLDLFETKTLKRRKNPINSDWLQVDPNSSTALRCLQDLIMNPYEDIRATASRLLSDWCTSQAISVNCTVDYSNFRCRGQSKADSSGRADIADGLGRIYVNDYKNQAHSIGPNQCAMKSTPVSMVEDLVSLLESKITTAASDLGHAVRSTPMHAELHGIRYILDVLCISQQQVSETQSRLGTSIIWRLLRSCEKLWSITRLVLCDDSPEGFKNLEPNVCNDPVSTKALLSFCWRALKESSLLSRALIMLVTKEPGGLIISERVKILKTAGQMSFDQLSSLRHRGAFTTVSATFETSCWLCKQLNTPETLSLLGTWYEQTFIYMREKSLVVTRRSAGLPNLLIGILSADPQGEAVETSILALLKDSVIPPQKFDKLNIDLPQVHAMNCLRAILNTSRLSTVKFASRVLKVAANSLSSNVWAIRNCGSMLFRTVVDQLFGTNIAQECNDPLFLRPAVRISYDSHPELLLVLEEILDNNSTAKFTNQEAVILALEVLYRSGSSAADQRDLRRKVRPYQGDRVWHVRVLAARTLCVLCDEAELVKEFVTAMNSQTLSQNRLHGELLCARELISRFFGLSSPMEHQDQQILQAISCGTQTFLLRNTCPFTQSLFVDIINFVYSKTCVCECENNSSICQCLGATLTSDQFGILKEAACSQSKTNGAAPLRRSLGILHCLTAWKRRSRASIRESILWLDDAADEGLIDAILHSLLNGTLLEQARESSWDAQYWAEVLLCLLEPNSLSVTAQEEGWTYMPLILEKPGVLPELLKSQSFPQRLAGFERQFNDRMLSPSKQNANLITLGYAIRLGILQGQGRSKHLESRIQQWILLISNAAKDSNNLDTRISGIRSLRAGLVGLDKKICDLRSGLFISVYFALYNYLNDDDKSIREVASDVVSQVLGGTDIVKTPIAAAEELLESLSATFAKESEFFHQVTAQLFRQDIVSSDPKERCSMVEADLFSNLFLRPIETSVSDRQTAETVLFAEEKQNLYLDPILETTRWTQVLLNISVDQKSPKVTEAIRTWTEQGLKFLIKTAAKEEDGALGWTSKPEVFEIGYRLIKTAQVVLRWLKDVNEKNSISQLLREFITISEENLVHGLWIKAAREVVASIV